MKLRVDTNLCSGHAQCVLAAPDLIELDDEGYAKDSVGEIDDALADQARAAVDICPEQAIRIEE